MAQWTVSTTGGYEPRWRADGREMYYLSTDQKLMAVAVGPGPTFGKPMELFPVRGDAAIVPITVVLNWTARLEIEERLRPHVYVRFNRGINSSALSR